MRRSLFILAIITGIIILTVAWWLLSPLFLNEVVDEQLPIRVDTYYDIAEQMTDEDPIEDEPIEDTRDTELAEDAELAENTQEPLSYSGMFMDGVRNYKTSGIVNSLESDGNTYLRFEQFETTNGPDLFVYLVAEGMNASDGINLGKLRGNVGNQNYNVPFEIDLGEYSTIVIWCRAFDRVFGFADLTL